MCMKRTLEDALDDLSSSRSSLTRRSRALDALEHILVKLCVPICETQELDAFLRLQDNFEYNVASRLMHYISTLTSFLQQSAHSVNTESAIIPDVSSTCRIIIQSLLVLQGVALLHPSSKLFLSRRWCIQIFADLLSISRQFSFTLLSSSCNTDSHSSSSHGTATLASCTIDTLLCVLVDAPAALRTFEEVDGLEMVVKILKRTGVAKDIRMKCIEFLYFYLLDETGEVTLIPDMKAPKTFSSPQKGSRTTTTTPRPPSLDDTSSSRSASPDSTTPPPTPRTPRKAPRHLALLRKDLDFVPVTPKKVSRLDVTTPRAGARTLHSPRPGRCSPVDFSFTPASPTKRRHIFEHSPSLHAEQCHGHHRRSTQEKKEILGSLLGNVDTLVEGVTRSGIWGLG